MGFLDVIKKWFQPRHGMQAWVEIGQDALSRGELDEAEAAFTKAGEATPNAEIVTVGFIQIALLRDHVARALNLYEQMSERQQRHHHELLLLALSLQSESLTPRAYALWMRLPSAGSDRLKGLRELCQRHPKCGFLAAQWAELALQSFQLEEADVALRLLRDADPSLSERQVALLYARRDVAQIKEHLEVGRVLEEASQIEEPHARVRRLEPMANEYMHIAPLQHDTGLAFFQAGRPEVAIRYLNRAVGTNPYWVNAWVHLGAAAFAARRIVRARGAFARVLRLQHHDWIAALFQRIEQDLSAHPELPLLEKALDRMEAGDPTGAILPLRQALTIRADAPPLLRALGEALLAKRDFREALSIFENLLKESKNTEPSSSNADLHHKLALCAHRFATSLIAQQRYKEAEEQLTALLLIDPDLSVVEDDLRLIQQAQTGEVSQEAFQLYESAQPSGGLSLEQQIAVLSEALESSPRFVDAMLIRAVLRAEKGELEAAQDEISRALDLEKGSWRLRFHQAGLAFLLKDRSAARATWQACAASKKQPWSEFAASNLRALSSGMTARLLIVALPEHRRVIEFSPAAGESEVPSEILQDPAQITLLPLAPLLTEPPAFATHQPLQYAQKHPREAFADALADAFDVAHLADIPPSAPSSSSMEMLAVDPTALQRLDDTTPAASAASAHTTPAASAHTTPAASAHATPVASAHTTPAASAHTTPAASAHTTPAASAASDDLFPDARSAGVLKVLSPEDAVRRNQSVLDKAALALDEPSDFFASADEKDLFADEIYPLTAEPSVLIASIEPTSFITPSFFDLPSYQNNAPKDASEPAEHADTDLLVRQQKDGGDKPLFEVPTDAASLPLALPPQAQKEWAAGTSIDIHDKDALWETYQALSKQKVPRLSVVLSQPDKPLTTAESEEITLPEPVPDTSASSSSISASSVASLSASTPEGAAIHPAPSTVSADRPAPLTVSADRPTPSASSPKTPVPAALDDLFGELDVPTSAIQSSSKKTPPPSLPLPQKTPAIAVKPTASVVPTNAPAQKSANKDNHPTPKKEQSVLPLQRNEEIVQAKPTEEADPWGGSSLLDSFGANKMSFHETFPSSDELLSFLDDAIDGLQEKKSDKNQS